MVDNDSPTMSREAEKERHQHMEQESGIDESGSSDDNNSNLLFSCQCVSARKVATLLSCLRRVVTVGGGGIHAAGTSSTSHHQHHGGGGGGGISQSIAAAKAIAGGSSHKIQHVTVYAGPDGLTFHVQHGLAKQAQCSVDMPKTMFRDYYVGEEEVWVEDSDDDETNHDGGGSSQWQQQQQRERTGRRGAKEIIQGGEFSINLTTVLDCFSVLSKTGNKPSFGTSGGVGGNSGNNHNTGGGGEYAALSNVPLCMSYDRGTATLHLELLESGSGGGGCLVTCEIPGVAVADDVDDGPEDDDTVNHDDTGYTACNTHSGLAAAFRSSPILTRAILCSDALQTAVAELYDVPGAKVVQISLTTKGLEFGTIGPRSEVWVNVPYHRGQRGLYVGLESYNRIADDNNIVRRYPLGAFLSGMRGLDIGIETCISVNARGIMAIQHQVAREGCLESGSTVRPSFVDFIMICIEEEDDDDDDDNNDSVSTLRQVEVNDGQHRMHSKSGLQDITNTESLDEEIPVGRKTRMADARSRANNCQRATKTSYTTRKSKSSSPEDEEQHSVSDGESASPAPAQVRNDTATSRLLDELEVDKDLISSHKKRASPSQGRKDALDDIRRRRLERQYQGRSLEDRNVNEAQMGYNQFEVDDFDTGRDVATQRRKRNSISTSDAGSRKNQRSGWSSSPSDEKAEGESEQLNFYGRHSKLAQDTQSQSEDDDGDETEDEDTLDVTAEIPLLFSKRHSMSTVTRRSNGEVGEVKNDVGDDNESEIEQEPRMMYGDTKLEFTQDSYDST